MGLFTKIQKNDAAYAELTSQLDSIVSTGSRFPYNELATNYNDLAPNEHLEFPLAKNKLSALVQQLDKRGLARNADYKAIVVPVKDDETGREVETAFITRYTTVAASIIESNAGRRPLSDEEKADRAAEREADASAGKGKGKGKKGS